MNELTTTHVSRFVIPKITSVTHSFFIIRNSIFFQAASFLIFRDFEPASFLISFLNSLTQFRDVILCRLKSHILVRVTSLLGFSSDFFSTLFLPRSGKKISWELWIMVWSINIYVLRDELLVLGLLLHQDFFAKFRKCRACVRVRAHFSNVIIMHNRCNTDR